jgi:hypothetical protein
MLAAWPAWHNHYIILANDGVGAAAAENPFIHFSTVRVRATASPK